jgi:hypothetical protein
VVFDGVGYVCLQIRAERDTKRVSCLLMELRAHLADVAARNWSPEKILPALDTPSGTPLLPWTPPT